MSCPRLRKNYRERRLPYVPIVLPKFLPVAFPRSSAAPHIRDVILTQPPPQPIQEALFGLLFRFGLAGTGRSVQIAPEPYNREDFAKHAAANRRSQRASRFAERHTRSVLFVWLCRQWPKRTRPRRLRAY